MPRLSCWFVRAALVHLVAGATAGALLLAAKGLSGPPALWRLLTAHQDLLLLGWTAQLAMGVAFWILPRFQGGASRGDERPAWLAFWLLNAGVLLSSAAPLVDAALAGLAGRVLEAGAVVAFAVHAWARVRPASPGPPAQA